MTTIIDPSERTTLNPHERTTTLADYPTERLGIPRHVAWAGAVLSVLLPPTLVEEVKCQTILHMSFAIPLSYSVTLYDPRTGSLVPEITPESPLMLSLATEFKRGESDLRPTTFLDSDSSWDSGSVDSDVSSDSSPSVEWKEWMEWPDNVESRAKAYTMYLRLDEDKEGVDLKELPCTEKTCPLLGGGMDHDSLTCPL